MRQLWRERQIVVPAVSLYLYSFWGREKYLINYEKKQILLQTLAHKEDFKFKRYVKKLVAEKVFANEKLPSQVGPMLLFLVKDEPIKILMTDLFIFMLRDKIFVRDANILVSRIVHQYLLSKMCQDDFNKIILNEVLRNEKDILPAMYQLLTNFLLHVNRPYLTDQSTVILQNVLNIDVVTQVVIDNIVREAMNSLENKIVIDAAVQAGKATF